MPSASLIVFQTRPCLLYCQNDTNLGAKTGAVSVFESSTDVIRPATRTIKHCMYAPYEDRSSM